MPFRSKQRSRGGPGDQEAEVLLMRRPASPDDYDNLGQGLDQRYHDSDLSRRPSTGKPLPPLPGQSIKVIPRRRGFCGLSWLQAVALLPLIVLAFFGVVHLLRVAWSDEGLFVARADDQFLPDWGKPGHQGQFKARYPTDATRDVIPIPCHSHNDYWRRIPLHEGIHYGCTGTEADVWLKHGELFVGHMTWALTANRTFKSLYVNPLLDLLEEQNPKTDFGNASGNGVFDEDPSQSLILLVDFKTDGHETFPVVSEQLAGLREKGYLTHWNGSDTVSRAITVVATGNAPFDLIVANTTYRDIFFDAPLHRLASDVPAHAGPPGGQGTGGTEGTSPEDFNPATSYYASTSLHEAVGGISRGKFSEEQLSTIRAQIKAAQKLGLKARYWDTPAWPISLRNYVWQTLVNEGVDYLNVDDLRSAARLDWRHRTHELFL